MPLGSENVIFSEPFFITGIKYKTQNADIPYDTIGIQTSKTDFTFTIKEDETMIKTENSYSASNYYSTVQQKPSGTESRRTGKQEEVKSGKTGQTKLSEKAQALLEKLRRTHGNMDFMVADYDGEEDAKSILSRGTKEVSVLFSTEELEKMASSGKTEKEYMDRVQGALRMSDQINKEFGFTAAGKNGGELSKVGISFNADGTTSLFAELEKSSASQRERIQQEMAERRAHRKDAEKPLDVKPGTKRVSVSANSLDELVEKMRQVDWNKVKEDKAEEGRKFDYSI